MSEPNEQQLVQALRRADEAGDTAAAQAIARRIQTMRQSTNDRGNKFQQVARGLGTAAANVGAGLADAGGAVAGNYLAAADKLTGGWEFPERLREQNTAAREQFRQSNEARNQEFDQNATGLERGSKVAGDVAAFFSPASKVDKVVKGAGMMTRMGGQALGAMGLDAAMQQGEGVENLDLGRTAITGAAGAGGELIAPVIGKAIQSVSRTMRGGSPIERGRAIAQEAGFGDLPDEVLTKLAKAQDEIKAGADPEAILFEATNDVRLSRAQKTGNRADWRAEEALMARNNPRMTQFREAQRGDVERLAARQTNNLDSPQTAIDDVQRTVQASKDEAKDSVNRAWKFAKTSDLELSSQFADDFARNVEDAFRADGRIVNENIAAPARAAINDTQAAIGRSVDETGGINFKAIEEARKMFSTNYGAMNDGSSKAAFSIARQQFDKTLDDITEAAVIRGDVEDIQKLRQANSISREVFRRFSASGSKDRVGKIVERIVDDGNLDDLSNFLLGASAVSKPASANAAKAVRRAVGDNPEVMGQLKDAVLLKALTNQAGDVSGEKAISSNLKKLLRGRRELLGELFTKREISGLEVMAKGFDSMSSPFPSSGTAERLTAFREYMNKLPLGDRVGGILDTFRDRQTAKLALSPLAPAASMPALPAAAAGATSSQSTRQ